MALTDTWLKANHKKEREKTEVVSDRDGLSVRISPKGKITFQMRYRHNSKADRIDLGSYPNLSLKNARQEVLRLKAELEAGHNPKTVKALEKVSIAEASSFEELTRQWYRSDCEGRITNDKAILRSFELHVFPKYGHLPANQVTPRLWYDLLEQLSKSIPGVTNRILIYTKQVYKWAVRREMVEYNPVSDISSAKDLRIKENSGKRVLSDEEIAHVWEAIDCSNVTHRSKLFLKLCFVYGCRGIELRTAERKHFDFQNKVWTIPTELHKTGKKHDKPPIVRPIIPITEEWLKEAMDHSNHPQLIFSHTTEDTPMSKSSVLALPYSLMQWVRTKKDINMDHWSIHDLRRTARTNWSTITSWQIAELMLGHALPGVQDVYDKHQYIDEKREAYEKWWDRLKDIVGIG